MSAEHFAKGDKKIHCRGENENSEVDNTNILMSRWYQKRKQETGRGFFRGGMISHTKMKCALYLDIEWDSCSVLFRSKKEQMHCKPVCISCFVAFSFPVNNYIRRVKKKKYIYITPWYVKSKPPAIVCVPVLRKGLCLWLPTLISCKDGFQGEQFLLCLNPHLQPLELPEHTWGDLKILLPLCIICVTLPGLCCQTTVVETVTGVTPQSLGV